MKPALPEPSAALPNDSPVPLDAILCTEELKRRPARPCDYERENRALSALATALADSPRTILQTLADTILEIMQAGSAGISLLTEDEQRFHWPAISGIWKSHIGGGTPRDFGPCGDVLDRDCSLLMTHVERRYAYFAPVKPPVEECLLAPFYVKGKAVGTIWAIAHDDRRKFDAEDLRQLESLARFASAAYQTQVFLDAAEQRGEVLRQDSQRDAAALLDAQNARRAALNLMDDAVRSRQTADRLGAELRVSEERFRALFDAAPMAVFVCDIDAVIQHYNARAKELWGREPVCGVEQHCGSVKLWLPDGSLLPHTKSPMVEVLRTGVPAHNVEVFIERPDGSRLPVLVNFAALKNERGEITAAITSFSDITERKQAETALRESEERYRTLFNLGPVAVYSCDTSGVIQDYNRRATELWGREPAPGDTDERFCGSFKMFRPDDRFMPHDQCPMAEVLSGAIADVRDGEVVIERPDGSRVTVVVNIRPLKNERGEITGAINCFVDITERKRAEEALRASEERYRTLFSSMDEGYCVIEMLFDPDGRPSDYRFLEVNPAFKIQSGMHDVTGKRMRELAPKHEARWFEIYGTVALTGEPVRFVNEAKALQRWFDVYAFRLGEPDSRKVAVLFTDITEHTRNTLDLERLRDEAVAAARAKDEFLATLSHELRTPLNPVLLLASEAATNDELPEELRADFDMIRKNISLEARLIDDLLDITRISRGKLKIQPRPCDAHTVLRDAVAVVRGDVDEKNIHLSLSLAAERATVFGDPVRLQQIFWNVLRNAVHFTPKEGTITVQSRVNPSSDELVVTMTDTGAGIVAVDLTRIFETFAQGADAAAGPSRRGGGLGLGLAISRKLVELHTGTIEATSPGRGGGSTFTIKLPLLAEPADGSPKAAKSDEIAAPQITPTTSNPFPRAASEPKARVLVVEDHASTRTALQRLLERRNFEVLSASSVAGALEVANQGMIDLIISDIGLPDADGYSLMRHLRVSRPGLLGIALSGYGAESDLAKSREAGFAEHLIKPVSIENLDRVLKRLGRCDPKSS